MNADGQGTPEKDPYRGFWDMLTQAERADLRAVGRVTEFGPGETICTEGERTTHVLVLTHGWVKIVLATRDQHEMTLALRGHGDIVGELAESSAGHRTATIVTIGLVRALVVAHDRFGLFLDSNPGAGRAYRQVVTERWREAAEMLRRWSVSTGAQRLAGLLLDLADRHGTHADSGTVITIPLSQEEMASLIGASRATVTRALGDWRRRGLIGTARHQITIMSIPGLRSAAGRDVTDRVRDR
jgi:CRP/FNR family transcriptional regulator, cyclic AMP receptor protein